MSGQVDHARQVFRLAPPNLPTARYNAPVRVLILHGRNSVPGGLKATCLARRGHEVLNLQLPDDDIDQAANDRCRPDAFVGLSWAVSLS